MLALALTAALLLDPASHQRVAPAKAPATRPAADAAVETVTAPIAVTVECTAKADGRVTDCVVLGETHPGLGFGEAAVALMNGTEVVPGPEDIQFARTIQFTP